MPEVDCLDFSCKIDSWHPPPPFHALKAFTFLEPDYHQLWCNHLIINEYWAIPQLVNTMSLQRAHHRDKPSGVIIRLARQTIPIINDHEMKSSFNKVISPFLATSSSMTIFFYHPSNSLREFSTEGEIDVYVKNADIWVRRKVSKNWTS